MLNMNPKQMEKMMKQMGIKNEPIDAEEVIIKKNDGEIRIRNPSVTKVTMQGNETFQITGDIEESSGSNEEDIKLVMEQTGKSREEAEMALSESDDIAQAIMKLSE